MVEHKQFKCLYLGKLANTTKKNFGKPKMYIKEHNMCFK